MPFLVLHFCCLLAFVLARYVWHVIFSFISCGLLFGWPSSITRRRICVLSTNKCPTSFEWAAKSIDSGILGQRCWTLVRLLLCFIFVVVFSLSIRVLLMYVATQYICPELDERFPRAYNAGISISLCLARCRHFSCFS